MQCDRRTIPPDRHEKLPNKSVVLEVEKQCFSVPNPLCSRVIGITELGCSELREARSYSDVNFIFEQVSVKNYNLTKFKNVMLNNSIQAN
jgi:hypothetical protein